jgi:hypothetical protein
MMPMIVPAITAIFETVGARNRTADVSRDGRIGCVARLLGRRSFLGIFGLLVVLFVTYAIWVGEGLFWLVAGLTLWIVIRMRFLLAKERRRRSQK